MTTPHDETGGYDSRAFVAEFYDFVPLYAQRADQDFYLEYARRAGGQVLELGCGTGRLLIPIARAGIRITGIDLSQAMLARCRDKLAAESPEVQARATLVHGDITNFSLVDKFPLAIAPFRCFQHLLTVEKQLACLRCVNRHLPDGGLFVLDVFQVSAPRMHDVRFMREQLEFADVRLPDGRVFSRSNRMAGFHRAEQINDVELIYDVSLPDGKRERLVHAFPLRYLFRYEVEHMLARCGFAVVDLFGDYDKAAIDDDSSEMIFVAKKIADAG